MDIKMFVITLTVFTVCTIVNAVTPVCDASDDKVLCSKMTKDAPTWAGAMTNAVNYELAVVKSGKSIVDGIGSKLPENLEPNQKQDIIDTCNTLYNGIITNLNKALMFVKKDPSSYALQGAISTSFFHGCRDEISEVALIDPPADVDKFVNEIRKNNDVLLELVFSRPKA